MDSKAVNWKERVGDSSDIKQLTYTHPPRICGTEIH